MSASSSASPRAAAVLLSALLSLGAVESLSAETVRWYASDAAGIAYEALAAAAAQRSRWVLEVRTLEPGTKSAEYSGSLGPEDRLEIKMLYENGAERKRTVSVLDRDGFLRFEESRTVDGFLRRERYDSFRRLAEETIQAVDGTGMVVVYEWVGDRIHRSRAFPLGGEKGEPLWVDRYRYDRSGALRSIEREPEASSFSHVSPRGTPRLLEFREPDGSSAVTRFDELGRETETVRVGSDGKTVVSSEQMTYVPDSLDNPAASSRLSVDETGLKKETFLDDKGRAVRDVVYSSDGSIAEETTTEWSGDRIAATTTARGGRVQRIEYGYDDRGNRILEENYTDGVLERRISRDGSIEIEELYRNGAPVLRSTYEDGILQREERIRSVQGSAR